MDWRRARRLEDRERPERLQDEWRWVVGRCVSTTNLQSCGNVRAHCLKDITHSRIDRFLKKSFKVDVGRLVLVSQDISSTYCNNMLKGVASRNKNPSPN